MKQRRRTCGAACHNARGTRCHCVCGSHYHGTKGQVNREALLKMESEEASVELARHGIVKGESVYTDQAKMDLSEGSRH